MTFEEKRKLAAGGEAAGLRHVDAQVLVWIDWRVIDANFVVKMRSSAASAQTDVAEDIPAMNMLT